MRINKAKDLIERVGWSFIQAEIALGLLDWLASGFNLNLVHQVYASLGAAAAATIKVLIAQRFSKDGSAIPGGITTFYPCSCQGRVSSGPALVPDTIAI